ncbi:hypothetical protein CEXT_310071 [Caerostris extrusa]|uniref:Secreted protein n=1 Tax=Caerostris extrusa TaxID=172846 RepID=A0AAV4P4A1_CAEEX|nr:hypothetical protein CEXT_310071 [Caerostris extrusa]
MQGLFLQISRLSLIASSVNRVLSAKTHRQRRAHQVVSPRNVLSRAQNKRALLCTPLEGHIIQLPCLLKKSWRRLLRTILSS